MLLFFYFLKCLSFDLPASNSFPAISHFYQQRKLMELPGCQSESVPSLSANAIKLNVLCDSSNVVRQMHISAFIMFYQHTLC